ncbi:MAG: CHC2 zinc finger domain-containing protein [Thermodesulfobacteriota bacterium]|nr:CHC2 zinc finger domain-containing protein [Thermodesulfobacteriota bacterium]
MIEQEKIDLIKTSVDMVALAEAKGIRLKKNGKSWFGLCPFHNEKNPSFSVTPSKNEWHCFGCGKGGDPIRFIELFDQVDFKEAVSRLSPSSSATGQADNGFKATDKPAKKKEAPKKPALTAKLIKLFNRVIEFYHTAFAEVSGAKEYLNKRGITDNAVFADYKAGYANGTLLNVLPDDGEIKTQLTEIGILNDRGKEHFYGCVTLPIYDTDGNPCGMYGRRIKDGSAPHLYLAGERHGVFNWQAVKSHQEVILTESIIDSLTLINAGIKNTIPCYGVNGFTPDHLNLFKQYQAETVYICLDPDESGIKAAEAIKEKLRSENIRTYTVNLPENQDINDFFLSPPAGQAGALDSFKELLNQANPGAYPADKKETETVTRTEYGFVMTVGERTYEVMGLVRRDSKLKATVKGIKQEKAKKRLHVDTVDFYSARSRAYLVKGLCDLYGKEEAVITNDVERMLELAEKHRQSEESTAGKKEMTGQERKAALGFLKNPDMFDEILTDFETLGYTGEEMNKLLCYVAAVSRKMESPLSVMIQSRSAAGKSYLQDTVLSLIPDEDFVKYTRLTDQALFYTEKESLKHKILAIEELDGMNGAIYSIRSIQSSKEISIAYTGKDVATGEQKTMENKVEGPLMVFITTTQVDIDGETASRFVFISIDESEAMTQKVLAKQRQSQTMAGMLNKLKSDEIIKKHHNANKLLRPLYVFNPYAELLTFTSKSLRARRDHTKYLNLIQAVCYLFQYQRRVHTMEFSGRTIEYINITLADIEKANTIANYVLGRSLDELPPPSRALLKLIQEMVKEFCRKRKTQPEEYHFTRRDIREFSGWSDFQIKTHIRQLVELEYLYVVIGKKGKEYVYELLVPDRADEENPFLVGLTGIKQLKEKAQKAGIKDD